MDGDVDVDDADVDVNVESVNVNIDVTVNFDIVHIHFYAWCAKRADCQEMWLHYGALMKPLNYPGKKSRASAPSGSKVRTGLNSE